MKTAIIMQSSWKEYLLRQARIYSMCEENIEGLKACQTKAAAVSLYKKTIDWALEKDFPSLDFIRKEFAECRDLGIFVDTEFRGELLNEHQCYVFHNCHGHLTVDLNVEKRIIPMLYFANGCNLRITRAETLQSSHIKVPLYIYGENTVIAEDTGDITFTRKGGAR